jgi:hypothetical protein
MRIHGTNANKKTLQLERQTGFAQSTARSRFVFAGKKLFVSGNRIRARTNGGICAKCSRKNGANQRRRNGTLLRRVRKRLLQLETLPSTPGSERFAMKSEFQILEWLLRDWNFYSEQPGVARCLLLSYTLSDARLRIVFRALMLHSGNWSADCREDIRKSFLKIGADYKKLFAWAEKVRAKKPALLLPEKCGGAL